MIKIFLLASCIFGVVAFCESSNSNNGNLANANTLNFSNKEFQVNTTSSVDWRNIARFKCISSIDNKKIWATTAEDGRLLFTEDAGLNWNVIRAENTGCVDFVDDNHGWLIDRSLHLWVTNDAGRTWSRKNLDIVLSTVGKIKFNDLLNGWILDGFNLFYTKDGGNSWKPILSYKEKFLRGMPADFFFLNNQVGWACDGGDVSGWLYHTTEPEKIWIAKRMVSNSDYLCRIFFINPVEGWYSIGPKNFFSTSDGGKTWKKISSLPANFVTISMYWFNPAEGWLAGFLQDDKTFEPMNGKSVVLRTMDGGKTWADVKTDESSPFFVEINFSDSQNGRLVSRDSIRLTNDGGKTWNLSFRLPPLSSK